MKARQAKLILRYDNQNISAVISPYILSFNYEDNAKDKSDSIDLTLEDSKSLWHHGWFPIKGSKVSAMIVTENWNHQNMTETLNCGAFEVDEVGCSGPPQVVSMKAIAIPTKSKLTNEKKNKAWELMYLKDIGMWIASNNKVNFLFESDKNPKFDRVDQNKESDLAFLSKISKKVGLSVKFTDNKIVIFDESKYEQKKAIRKFTKGESDLLTWGFDTKTKDVYSSVTASYFDSKLNKNIVVEFKPQNGPKVGSVLKINEALNYADIKNATKDQKQSKALDMAKGKLREKNKNEFVGSLTIVGDPSIVTGVNIEIDGFGVFNGKYAVNKAIHSITDGGYTVKLDITKVLEGY